MDALRIFAIASKRQIVSLCLLLMGWPLVQHAQPPHRQGVCGIGSGKAGNLHRRCPDLCLAGHHHRSLSGYNRESGFEQVSAHQEWFVPNEPKGQINRAAVYWMKVELKAGAEFQDTCLFFIEQNGSISSWEEIDAWLVHQDGRIEQQAAGLAIPPSDRSIPSGQNKVGFGLDPGEEAHLFVRVAGGGPAELPPSSLGMFAKRVKRMPEPYSEVYQFKGIYHTDDPISPFRFNYVWPISILTAPDPALKVEEIVEQGAALNWRPSPQSQVVRPQRGKVYWIKTRLTGSPTFNGKHIFSAGYKGNDSGAFDYVDIFTAKNGGAFTRQRTGTAVPAHERPYDFWAIFFRIELNIEDTLDVYVRLEGLNRNVPMPVLTLMHIDPDSVFPRQVNEARKKMFVLGAMAMQFLFFAALFLIERERIHFYFAMYILGGLIISSSHGVHFNSQFPVTALSRYFRFFLFTGITVSMISILKFTEVYFNYPRHSLFRRRIVPGAILLISIYTVLLMVITNIDYPLSIILGNGHNLIALMLIGITIWMGLAAPKDHRTLQVIFLIGIALPALLGVGSALTAILFHLGLMADYQSFWMEILPFTFLFVYTVFSLSIGYRKNLLKREKEQALEASLKAQETIIEKLEETARLEKMDEVKTRFFTNITHEFRTPLTVILGLTDQLNSEPDRQKRTNGLSIIKRNGQKLLHLINRLLDLSKIDAATLKPRYQSKEVVSFVQYVGESFESLAEKKGVRLSIYSEIDELTMAIDPDMLQQIIANLLSNAIKFTPARGKVVLHLSRSGDHIQLKVKDTGEGIAEEALPHIFDRFYQVDNSASRQGEGTGIGLALVKELVQVLEGDIQVKSQVERGTELLVRLPITSAPDSPLADPHIEASPLSMEAAADKVISPPISSPVEAEISPSLPRLLIVEDNPDVVYYLQSVLQDQYQLHIATEGQQGIDQAIETVPDIIISDVMMPKKDGFELVEALKTDERSSHIPIILLTAKATQDDKIAGLRHGADAYLMKPFDKEELLIRLKNLLENRRAMQQRYGTQPLPSDSPQSPSPEDLFMAKLQAHLEAHYEDSELGVKDLAGMLDLSHQQFYRKLKALTNQTPVRYLRTFRLQKAHALLRSEADLNVSEVAYAVGFDDPNYFSRVFGEAHGVSPNEVMKR